MTDVVTCPTCLGPGKGPGGSAHGPRCTDCAGTGEVTRAHKARILRERAEARDREVRRG